MKASVNFKRFKSLYTYSMCLWLAAPFIFDISTVMYKRFTLKGVLFALVLSSLFYVLDTLTNRIIAELKKG